ncbi:MAG: hypothetical protein OSJ65_05415 [Bacilli bacterium]|nr:hypothetical protein [Bacilli bacterium]
MKRKIIGIILAIILFTPNSVFAAAALLRIEDVVDSFNKSKMVSSFDGLLGTKTQMKLNKTNQTLDVTMGTDEEFISNSLKYTNSYIELDNRNLTPTAENIGKGLLESVQVLGIIDALFSLSGYENKTLKEDAKPTDFNKYGLILETEILEQHEENNGITIDGSIEYLKYFKISLDKYLIENLVKEYGTDIEEFKNPFLNDLKPKLNVKSTSTNTVTLGIEFEDELLSSTYPVYADIYRATSIDGEYIKINSEKIDYAKEDVTFTDTNLESGKTYYYKAIMDEDKELSSNILTVETIKAVPQTVENPKTGLTSPFILLPITLLFGNLYFLIKKKNLFKNI